MLFRGRFQNNRLPIGIDFGAHSLKMLQLGHRGGRLAATAAARAVLPANLPPGGPDRQKALVHLLRSMMEEGRFSGRAAVAALPAALVQYKNLRVPRMPFSELKAAVQWEAADRLKIATDSVRVQYFNAGDVRQGEDQRLEIILLAAPVQQVEEHVRILLDCGLDPQCVEVAPSALARLMMSRQPVNDGAEVQVVLDVGFSTSKVLIVRQGQVAFFKQIDIGGHMLDEKVADHLRMPLGESADLRRRLQEPEQPDGDEALFSPVRRENVERAVFESLRAAVGDIAREVALCLRYFSVTFRGRRPETLLLAGGESYVPQIHKLLAESAGIPVEPIRLGDGMDLSRVPGAIRPGSAASEWSVAAGLALWQPGGVAGKRGAA